MTELIQPRSATNLFADPTGDTPPWFKPDTFLSAEFNPEPYISELRTFVPFHTLRSELQSHLLSLNRELVDLINRDYADFVNLSTKLVDVDSFVLRMRAPLLELRDKIVSFRSTVEGSLVALADRLRQRSEAAAAREILELLLDTFHVVSKIEKLIKELPTVPSEGSILDSSSQLAESGVNGRETQSVLLERIASEMHRLKFYITHAQNLPFIENMEKRFQNTNSSLNTSLGHCFVDGLEHRDENVIFNCLRAYAAIDNTSNAEDLFRTTIVAPALFKIIPQGSSPPISDDLHQNYEDIKSFIESQCLFLFKISSRENSGLLVFDFLGNSILKEVLSAIQNGKPGAFSPGKPTQFLKNYKSSVSFLNYLESYCPARSAVTQFRSGATYTDFMKQWNIGVYFSLRFQEIAGGLDSALTSPSLTITEPETIDNHAFTLKQTSAVFRSMKLCWNDDVLIVSSSDKFLRLTLQLLSRYFHWISSSLASRKKGTLVHPGCEWAGTASVEDFTLLIHDINSLSIALSGNYINETVNVLSVCPLEIVNLVKDSILEGAKCLGELTQATISAIVESLVDKAVEDLRQLKGITATYRMTNKPLPVRHSPYVSGILRSLKTFLDSERSMKYLTNELRYEVLKKTANEITTRYFELAAELVSVARKTESSLQRIRQGAQRRAGGSSDVSENSVSDTDKICMQLFLDIQEFGRNLASVGVDASKISSYSSLWECVAPPDKQSSINF